MRRLAVLTILILSVIFVLAACGGGTAPEATGTPAAGESSTPTDAAPNANTSANAKETRIFYTNDGLGEIDPCG